MDEMEKKDKPANHESVNNSVEKDTFVWHQNITAIDLSGRNIVALDDKVILPKNLIHLNLSHNKLVEVPNIVKILDKLVILNLSHNAIEYFNDCPGFCHTLEYLDMSNNNLAGPPYWIWAKTPQNLTQLNLSYNMNITKSFVNGYFEELLQYKTLITEINIENCKLGKFIGLLSTFPKANSLCLGSENHTSNGNSLIEIPCNSLTKCCDLRSLKVCNTNVYTISPRIEMYKCLVEINLAWNDLYGLPNEFCNLDNLEICVLSYNKILYLPDDVEKLQKLCRLYIDNNEVCMLPDTITKLSNLRTLDVYNNYLEEVPNLGKLEELDLALNYFEEPEDNGYLEKKEKLRLLHDNRQNGRKFKLIKPDEDDEYGDRSSFEDDDEELHDTVYNGKKIEPPTEKPASSSEDWDSDSQWEPSTEPHYHIPMAESVWISFVKQKMKEGNFCPMDAHLVPTMEKVQYERSINPRLIHESDGQFDDCSNDSS